MEEFLQLISISKSYDGNEVLTDVSVAISKGELFFLLGPSGCGKTTLLRIIAGLTKPDRGRIIIGGRDITEYPAHKRKTIMVFQQLSLWPHMSVFKNVEFALALNKIKKEIRKKKVFDALRLVHMENFAVRKPSQLSGGQQQRVALARAIVTNPDCLLLDEPLSNLDPSLRVEMRKEIRRICKEAGLTTIYVTHDQKEALSIADRIGVIINGNLLQVGTPRMVYEKPSSLQIAELLGEINLIHSKIIESNRAGKDNIVKLKISGAQQIISAFLPTDEKFSDFEDVLVAIRPEHIKIGVEANANTLQVHIREASFLGEMMEIETELNRSAIIKIRTTEVERSFKEGETLTISVRPEKCFVFKSKRTDDKGESKH